MNPTISDFGLARLFILDQTHSNTSKVVGTFGYMAPEYAMHGQFSFKSDVFRNLLSPVNKNALLLDPWLVVPDKSEYADRQTLKLQRTLRYEGTVWDDLAHGKGVYVAEQGLVRYEGEWLRNNMEDHGVVEVDIPDIEPVPGSNKGLEEKMWAEGHIISRDFMSPEDREWFEKDIEDSMLLTDGNYETPWYESKEWIKHFGSKL